jgi:hypothetical protein
MAGYVNKVYVVQRANDELIAVKLTHLAAHQIAKEHAPAKVTCVIADKTTLRNVPAPISSQSFCN